MGLWKCECKVPLSARALQVSCHCRQTGQGLPTLGPRPHPDSSFPLPEAGPSCALHLGTAERCDTEEQSSSHTGPHVPSQDPPAAPTQRAQAQHQRAHRLPAWHSRAQPLDFKAKAGDKAVLDVSQLRQRGLRGPRDPTHCSCGLTSTRVARSTCTCPVLCRRTGCFLPILLGVPPFLQLPLLCTTQALRHKVTPGREVCHLGGAAGWLKVPQHSPKLLLSGRG